MSWTIFENHDASHEQTASYAAMLEQLHGFHDALAGSAPDAGVLDALASDLRRWRETLSPMAVPELDRLSGRLPTLPVRGHAAIPPIAVVDADSERFEGTVIFGKFFLGGGSAAHGGTIMMVFDEVLGVHASAGGRKAGRTAFLTTNFRAIVPIDVPIRVRAWFEREEGRKRWMRGEMWAGDTLCAEAEALFVELRESPL